MFPAIKDALRDLRAGFGSDVVSLGLKEDIAFNTTEAEKIRRIYPRIYAGGESAWSGENVNESVALNHSAVYACTRKLSETPAWLPLTLMRRTRDGRFAATEKPLYGVLRHEANERMTAMEFREAMTASCVLRGNAYARIVRRPGTGECIGLYPIHPSLVTPGVEGGTLYYDVTEKQNEKPTRYAVRTNEPHEIFHMRGLGFDGLQGQSIISLARQSIGTALASEKYAAKFYANGGRLPGILKAPANKFKTEQDFERFRSDWMGRYGAGSDSFHVPMILEGSGMGTNAVGWDYQTIGVSPEDAQFLQTRQFNIPEICRWFGVPPHLVGDLTRSTNNNIEHQGIEFVTQTLMGWLKRWEESIFRCLLTPQEKAQGLYAVHNTNALVRGDFQSRVAGYASMIQNGILSIDEVRELEDMNPLPDGTGKAHYINGASAVVPGTGEPTSFERAKVTGGRNGNETD
jgi:HK97 family phage portal protein